ncbi:hypothetical protein V5799_033244 [Amblyomma americanum]|uniref:Alcohol dehydrogenase transcription factor myb/sant-like protein n=1 Tax=Amblyomma americanum TaxID=6943 RepID=A0AAQ4DNV9_AMBAM
MALSLIDNETLIRNVECRPLHWQVKHKDHKNRLKKNILWAEVAAAVLPNVPNAENLMQKRWKSLRDKFRRILVANKECQKSGAGAEDAEESVNGDVSWAYYDQMMFLRDSVEGRPTSGNMTAQVLLQNIVTGYCDMEPLSIPPSENSQGQAGGAFTAEQRIATDMAVAPDNHSLLDEPPSLTPPPSPPEARPLQKKRKHESFREELEQASAQIRNNTPQDVDEHFAMSLVHHMRRVKPERRIEMQLRVPQVMQEFAE